MTPTSQRLETMPTQTQALRDPELRQHPVALVVLLHLWPELDRGDCRVKVEPTSTYFGAEPKSIRRALRWLVRASWLSVVSVDGRGTKHYAHGARTTKGGHGDRVLPFRPIVATRETRNRAA